MIYAKTKMWGKARPQTRGRCPCCHVPRCSSSSSSGINSPRTHSGVSSDASKRSAYLALPWGKILTSRSARSGQSFRSSGTGSSGLSTRSSGQNVILRASCRSSRATITVIPYMRSERAQLTVVDQRRELGRGMTQRGLMCLAVRDYNTRTGRNDTYSVAVRWYTMKLSHSGWKDGSRRLESSEGLQPCQ